LFVPAFPFIPVVNKITVLINSVPNHFSVHLQNIGTSITHAFGNVNTGPLAIVLRQG